MKKRLAYHLPNELKIYILLAIASVVAVATISVFLLISEFSQHTFKTLIVTHPVLGFIITPLTFLAIIYFAKYYCHFVQGSGIPQLIAATDSRNKPIRGKLLSFRVALGKIAFIFLAMLGGAPIGIEGPSIHIGGSIFYGFNHFIKLNRKFLIHALIAIGGSAGLIVAFNAPIAGFLFAYEEIGRNLKRQALILIAITAGFVYLLETFYHGNIPYLADLSAHSFDLMLIWQLLPLILISAILGGLFTKATLYLIKKLTTHSKAKIIISALFLGFIVAIFNYASQGQIAGSGHTEVLKMLDNETLGWDFIAMKYLATLTSFVSTIPGGIFMPSISIGAGLGAQVAHFYTQIDTQTIMMMTMISYLSAVIRAPLTATFIILEMTLSLHLLIPGLIVAFIANAISKQIQQQAVYEALADHYLKKA